MYSVDSLGGIITPEGVNEQQSEKHSYQWRQQGLRRLEETVAVTSFRQRIESLKEKC